MTGGWYPPPVLYADLDDQRRLSEITCPAFLVHAAIRAFLSGLPA